MVGGRWPTEVNIWERDTTRLTGRFTAAAAIAAAKVCVHCEPLQPNPPPTYGQMTCTFFRGMPKAFARLELAPITAWVASHTVRRSPCHSAIVAESSIGLCV